MALVGNISGSGGVSNTIGITGSLIIGNPGLNVFPVFPGSDVTLFVSGNAAPKPGGLPATSPDYAVRGTTVFGGDVVISGTLFGGSPLYIGSPISASAGISFSSVAATFSAGMSGSLTRLTDGTSYLIAGSNITISTGSTGAITISSTATGGGGSNFFSDTDGAGQIFTTGSAAFVGSGADYVNNIKSPADKGSDLFFYVSGSTAAGSNGALFGGRLITSGNLIVKDSSGAAAATLTNDGNVSITGNIDTVAAGAKTLFPSAGANTVTIGGATSTVVAAGTLQVNGSITTDTDEAKSIFTGVTTQTVTIGGAGSTVAVDALTVGGGYGSTGVTVSSAGTIQANGNLTVDGTSTLTGNVTISGDLTVNGTTVTVDSTTVEIEDPVIGLGFNSGSIAVAAGDRGFIGGITGSGNNVAFVWSNNSGSFVATKTTTGPGSAPVVVTQLQPIRASKFEAGSTNAYITSSNGSSLLISAASSNTINFGFNGTSFAEILESGVDAKFGATGNKNLVLSGTQITMVAGTNGTVFQRDTNVLGSVTGVASTSMTLAARSGATATSLVLSGSGLTLGANSTVVDFQFGTGAGSLRGVASNANGFTLGSQAGVNLNLSGSSNFLMRHGATGVGFQQHSLPYLTINSGSIALSTNTALITADIGKALLIGGAQTTVVSGSDVFLDTSANGVTLRKDSTSFAQISSPSANTFTISPAATFTTSNVVNTVATTVNFAGVSTTLNVAADATTTGTYNLVSGVTSTGNTKTINLGTGGAAGSTTNINIGSTSGTGTVTVNENMLPGADVTYDLGSPSFRWRNMYTGDLHLRNERGDWTIIEEREFLSITNNHTGRRYKFVLQEI